ncbi:unnamed protein product, partial [Closterium sp. NIES-54]
YALKDSRARAVAQETLSIWCSLASLFCLLPILSYSLRLLPLPLSHSQLRTEGQQGTGSGTGDAVCLVLPRLSPRCVGRESRARRLMLRSAGGEFVVGSYLVTHLPPSLCVCLGVWPMKAELEDLCFAVLVVSVASYTKRTGGCACAPSPASFPPFPASFPPSPASFPPSPASFPPFPLSPFPPKPPSQPRIFRQLRGELATMWSSPEDWRSLRGKGNVYSSQPFPLLPLPHSTPLQPRTFRQLRGELATMWSSPEDWRSPPACALFTSLLPSSPPSFPLHLPPSLFTSLLPSSPPKTPLQPRIFRQLRGELATMWSSPEDWRSLRERLRLRRRPARPPAAAAAGSASGDSAAADAADGGVAAAIPAGDSSVSAYHLSGMDSDSDSDSEGRSGADWEFFGFGRRVGRGGSLSGGGSSSSTSSGSSGSASGSITSSTSTSSSSSSSGSSRAAGMDGAAPITQQQTPESESPIDEPEKGLIHFITHAGLAEKGGTKKGTTSGGTQKGKGSSGTTQGKGSTQGNSLTKGAKSSSVLIANEFLSMVAAAEGAVLDAVPGGKLLQGVRDEEGEEGESEPSVRDLIEAVVPFDLLADRNRRSRAVAWPVAASRAATGAGAATTGGGTSGTDGTTSGSSGAGSGGGASVAANGTTSGTASGGGVRRRRTRVMRDAEVALTALHGCEEALQRELLITTPYVPGMEIVLSGRLKSMYSCHAKMRRKRA